MDRIHNILVSNTDKEVRIEPAIYVSHSCLKSPLMRMVAVVGVNAIISYRSRSSKLGIKLIPKINQLLLVFFKYSMSFYLLIRLSDD
jgi:hypothetical protein